MDKPNFKNMKNVAKERDLKINVDQIEEDWENHLSMLDDDRRNRTMKRYRKGGGRRSQH